MINDFNSYLSSTLWEMLDACDIIDEKTANLKKPDTFWPKYRAFLETLCCSYDTDKEKEYHFFFELLPKLIPCWECSEHCEWYIQSNPPDLQSKLHLLNRLNDFHNFVNKRNNKKQFTLNESIERISSYS